jgi:hypothetical protein
VNQDEGPWQFFDGFNGAKEAVRQLDFKREKKQVCYDQKCSRRIGSFAAKKTQKKRQRTHPPAKRQRDARAPPACGSELNSGHSKSGGFDTSTCDATREDGRIESGTRSTITNNSGNKTAHHAPIPPTTT